MDPWKLISVIYVMVNFQYVPEVSDKLSRCFQIIAHNADVSITRYKTYFDARTQDRQFKPVDEVLVLLPDSSSKLLVAWIGPYKVLERRNRVDYLIADSIRPKIYHANLLKRY